MMNGRHLRLPWAILLFTLCFAKPVFAADNSEHLRRFVAPLRAEAGPVISLPLGVLPASEAWTGFGLKYGAYEKGRAQYSHLTTRLTLGGEWSPKKLKWLGVGGSLVALQTTTIKTDLPPIIHEKDKYFDLGVLRVHARARAFTLEREPIKELPIVLVLTPFFRMGFPTDTSRTRQERRMPIRRVLDYDVMDNPYFLVEPGVSAGFLFWHINLYTHQAFVAAPIRDGETYWFYSIHNGVAARIVDMFELLFELNGLMRITENDRGRGLRAWAASPGIRFAYGDFSYEISSRFGFGSDPYHPYGKFTVAGVVSWIPGANRGK